MSARFCPSAQWKINCSAEDCVSFKPKTRESKSGPNSVIVVRIGTPSPRPPRVSSSAGNAFPSQFCPMLAQRARSFSEELPACARPVRSPLISVTKTGTPASERRSAMSWRVRVLPVPVAPATRQWRFIKPRGMPTGAPGTGVSPSKKAPSRIDGAVKEYPARTCSA